MPNYRRNRVPGATYFFTVNRDRQRGYWEHTIRDDRDYAAHADYIHFNPVKHGFVEDPGAWPFSSFRRCVAAGLYSADWHGGDSEPDETGER